MQSGRQKVGSKVTELVYVLLSNLVTVLLCSWGKKTTNLLILSK